jgi:lysine biosynthesis protein LysW
MAKQKLSNIALCPECDGPVQLRGKLHIGQRLSCNRCGSSLVITERRPLELDVYNDKHPDNGRVKAEKKKGHAQSSNEKTREQAEESPISTISRVSLADCPECTSVLRFHKSLRVGQLVVCPDCDETLEVVSLHPLDLSWANEDPWDYDERRYDTHD